MSVRVALWQARSGVDPGENAKSLANMIRRAAEGGAAMLFTPEMTGLLDRDGARADAAIRSEADDAVLAAARAGAARNRLWLQLGSLAIRREDGRLANRAYVIDDAGAVRATYDKLHLFDVNLPAGESWRESARYAPGEAAVLAETPVGRLGLTVCYDLRFPALFAALADAGATVFSVPSAFTVPTGEAHWHILLRARAIEAGAFVIAAAQAGKHEDGRETWGHSLVVDPWGRILVDMGHELGLAFVDLDLAKIDNVRARVPALRHRRAIATPTLAQ